MSASQLTDLVGRVLRDRYRLVAPIGRGATARVYLADDTTLRRRVAVKILHESSLGDATFLKRFEAEALAVAALNHPNVMHVYDSGIDGELPFIVSEYLAGGSLRGMIDAGHRLTPSQALLVGLDVARGLDYAHRRGFVHRDIKSANLLFGEEGRLRIADFGLARAMAEASWTEPEGMLIGTARYASPEQARGKSIDGKADVYSLGLSLIEAVTGSVPFVADTATATLMARVEGDVVVPAALGALVATLTMCGRLDPAGRPDAGELEIAFLAASEDMARPEPLPLVGALPPGADEIPTTELPDGAPVRSASAFDSRSITAGGVAGGSVGGSVALADDGSDDSVDWSTDLEVERPARRLLRVLVGLFVVLVLAGGGVGTWLALRTPTAIMPNLVGLDIAAAKAKIKANNWNVTVDQIRKTGTSADQVLAQSVKPRTSLEAKKTLKLTVSLGNELVTMPPLAKLSHDAATKALQAVGLVEGIVTNQPDEAVPTGVVISSSATVDSQGQLPQGSKVDLVVSSGPAPRIIPAGLVGQPLADVTRALNGIQLKANVVKAYSDQPDGTVLTLSQPDGASVPRDSTIDVGVSQGPAPVPIPDVTGKSVADATATLQAAGFPVSGVEGSPGKAVLATDPPANEAHVPGTPVRLFTRQ